MGERNLNLVVQFLDGTRRKGRTDRFDPRKPFLLLWEVDSDGEPIGYVDIEMVHVAAVFVVQDLALLRTRRHGLEDAPRVPPPCDAGDAAHVRVTFTWGEVLDGLVRDFDPGTTGFQLLPLGPLNRAYNVDRVWVRRSALESVEVLSPAEAGLQD